MRTILAGSSEPHRARAYERLLAAGCDAVLVTGSHAALTLGLRAWPEALVVIRGDEDSSRPYLQLAVRAQAPAVVLLDTPREGAQAMIRSGARGALHEDLPPGSLAAALNAVRCGLIVLDPTLLPDSRQASPAAREQTGSTAPRPLTRREQQIVSLIATGASNKDIARRLAVSSNTVKFHLAAIFAKLGVTTRAGAVAEALRRGELSL